MRTFIDMLGLLGFLGFIVWCAFMADHEDRKSWYQRQARKRHLREHPSKPLPLP
jgi:hypothetical protein